LQVKNHLKNPEESSDQPTVLPEDYQKELLQRCLTMMTPTISKREVRRFL
jgi:hypothetical protein